MLAVSCSGFSHEAAMLITAPASRFPVAVWSSGRRLRAPPSGKTMMAEWGETMRAACSRALSRRSLSGVLMYSDFQ
jgi:hypothetical protein